VRGRAPEARLHGVGDHRVERLHVRAETSDDLTRRGDEKLLEVPLDVTGVQLLVKGR
jgi:hypothetical protein